MEKIKKESRIFLTLQTIGRAFFLPVSILPVAGLLLGLGASFTNEKTIAYYHLEKLLAQGTFLNYILTIMNNVGLAVFANLPLIFAMAVAFGMAKKERGVAVLSAGLSFIIMHTTIKTLLVFNGTISPSGEISEKVLNGAIGTVLGIQTLEMGVFGGIITGLGVAFLHNKFYKTKLPAAISFFSGVRFVPIICTFSYIIVGAVSFLIWPFIQQGIYAIGSVVMSTGDVGIFIFGFMERILIPFGLHHIWYIPFWQTGLGGSAVVDGVMQYGAQNIFFAELASPNTKHFSIEAAKFMTGKYSFMMAGLPGAALAMYHCAKPEKRKIVGGLLFSAALTSFLTGITEPIEFTFLFVAPFVFVIHCIFAGLSFALMSILKIAIGTTFSCGLIDLTLFGILPGNSKTNWLMILPVFVLYFTVYYFFFKFVILKWNLKTPGREDDTEEVKLYTKNDYNTMRDERKKGVVLEDTVSQAIINGLGGLDNFGDVTCCATRLRMQINNMDLVNDGILKQTGAMGIIKKGNGIQVVYGPTVSVIKSNLTEYIDKIKEHGMEASFAEEKSIKNVDLKVLSLCEDCILEDYESLEEINKIVAPFKGKIFDVENINDKIFNTKVLGDGFAIEIEGNEILAPTNGKIINIYDTEHAFIIEDNYKHNILVHVGLGTVGLNGKGIKLFKKVGDEVKKGEKIGEIDKKIITESGFSLVSPVTFLNVDKARYNIQVEKEGNVEAGEEAIIFIIKK
ncbi:PTS transporter subunit IIABC [Pseudoleptotrichia goodfellowii]|uniref:PTS system, glucose-like IIB component n=1 Tax=Pseudoleptotrichia goodfellowii F0264 TaxID=596323 RepID=D0GN67_9FUSO|nr:glucose PTS transporter subunit IIA [Pseudoleptotrichia goodfellowii]EEY34421.1 PTS system, glucose-like IIB component [Pseudoleptotrichia goodfellowii F0264]